ncbi:SMP-30/gluconolactonase/LRE family protein [Nereida sp. MMG025]|uniref:SMP-30/gluconolactonase/LRE family protein n=1 Tax=Nereida sp. MMG025 TaxID=2909981 RepID=UPI001F2AB857|nr:SMP-30/gluconolactonase/LRE family protein [Nereida sp. MMG025]MCF6445808.1 SMP-30/gluconolactonase/LRE family protein [Nereida sp. MMG025]
MIFDDRQCILGEGPLWHPTRKQLFWFDIKGKRLLTSQQEWQFSEHVSAAGWLTKDRLLIASETKLFSFNLETGEQRKVADLEADNTITRSNDGRADPWGGFWIGTMGKQAEPQAGAIYRFYKGQLNQIRSGITISNAICFSPDKACAFYTDTPTKLIMRQALDTDGWPKGTAEVFVDLTADGLAPDGAVVDRDGNLWNAQWGASRIAVYDQNGAFQHAFDLPASQITCPALGPDGLYATSASEGVNEPDGGKTFFIPLPVRGQTEHQVIL